MQNLIDNTKKWFANLRSHFDKIVFEDSPVREKVSTGESKFNEEPKSSATNFSRDVNQESEAKPTKSVKYPNLFGGLRYRFIALCIDFFLLTVTFIVILFFLNRFVDYFNVQIQSDIEIPMSILVFTLYILLISLYFIIFECSSLKTTLGKHIFGLIVVDYNSNRLNFSRSFLRYLGKLASLVLLVLTSFQLIVILYEFLFILTTSRYSRIPTDDLHLVSDEQLRIGVFVISLAISIFLVLKIDFSSKNQAFHDNIAKTIVAFSQKSEQLETETSLRPKNAGFWERFVAFLIDIFVLLFFCGGVVQIYTPIIQDLIGQTGVEAQDLNVIVSLGVFAQNLIVVFLYYTVFVSSDLQGTLGKYVVGLKITDIEGEKITFFRAMVRFFANIFSLGLFFIGCLMVLWTSRKQALHDKVARTLVIKIR